MKFTADFETTTDVDDCRVWATGICSIDEKLSFYYGNSIDWLFSFFTIYPNSTFYFHNLKFDGEFILCYLFNNGFTHSKNRTKNLKPHTFNTLISDKGQFYSICIKLDDDNVVTIYDSLKILPFSVEDVAKSFNLPIEKLELDYKEKREPGHILTATEKEYLKHDVQIMAMALKTLFEQNLRKMTQGSNALFDFKNIMGQRRFKKLFPIPKYDADVRQSYRGGFTYCNPKIQGKDLGEGIVLDVNSLYPSVMYYNPLPYGEGMFFKGKYKPDKIYNLYVQMLRCNFEIKPNHIPTIQIKGKGSPFIPTEYLTSSAGEDVTLCLTSVDLEIFKTHYNLHNVEYISGWKFKSTNTLFRDYIDKWMKVKIESTVNGNKGMRTLAKLMLNALYGKFALNPKVQSKIPYMENGTIKYMLDEPETRDPIYIPVGSFITAWARHKTITSAQSVYDRFCYADTDSLHLLGTEIPKELEVDPVKLGAWDHEATFTRARFVRQKTYIEEIDGNIHITCAGMPDRCYPQVTWDNFKIGGEYHGKLMPQHVSGGIVLKDVDFKIRG